MLKNPSQTAFHEMFDEAKEIDRSISAAQVARWLGVSDAAVSNWLKGTRTPESSKLKLMQHELEKLRGQNRGTYPVSQPEQVIGMEHSDVRDDAAKLEDIRRADPRAFQTVREVIGTYHGAIKKGHVNSVAEDQAQASAPSALKLALHPDQASRPGPKAAGSTSYKRRRASGTASRSKSPPESPTQAPK